MKFSVLISTYHKESPEFLSFALDSLRAQTLQADEIVLVKDGPIPYELERVIKNYSVLLPLKIISIEKNVGLGKALQVGVHGCSYDYIARMDSDDIAREDRFEKQIGFLGENPDIDIAGSWISEFDGTPDNIYAVRRLPLEHKEIVSFAKKRNPLNHMTVVFKKESVLKAGNYTDYGFSQDYNLWVRMIMHGARFANLPEELVNVRAGMNMVARRSGLKYALNEYRLQKEFLDIGYISYKEFVFNTLIRVPVRFMPSFALKFVYRLLRR